MPTKIPLVASRLPMTHQLDSLRETATQNWATALQTYRVALDLYYRVLSIRPKRGARIRGYAAVPRTQPTAAPTPAPIPLPRPSLHVLSPREQEVAQLIALGYTNQQIADTLVLTRGTVANHVAHILAKLGATNRARVVALVLQGAPPMETTAIARDA